MHLWSVKFVSVNRFQGLTLSWRRSLLYRNQSIDLQSKSLDWSLYDRNFRHARVKWQLPRGVYRTQSEPIFTKSYVLDVWLGFECLWLPINIWNHTVLTKCTCQIISKKWSDFPENGSKSFAWFFLRL